MPYLTNLENNLRLELNFIRNYLFEFDSKEDYEKWIPFTLSVILPKRSIMIDEDARAAMSVYEIRNLVCGIENILEKLTEQISSSFEFYSGESFFGLKLEIIPEDIVVEVELWINVGSQTQGKIYGYDEGVRFATNERALREFLIGIKQELSCLEEIR